MGWWSKHRNAVIGGATHGLVGAFLGDKVDEAGGLTNVLFGEQTTPTAKKTTLPSRNDVIMNVLNEQIAAIKKKQQGQNLGTNMQADSSGSLLGSALFGV